MRTPWETGYDYPLRNRVHVPPGKQGTSTTWETGYTYPFGNRVHIPPGKCVPQVENRWSILYDGERSFMATDCELQQLILIKFTSNSIRKIAHKQMLWRVYKHTGNVEDYTNYKEALNLATTEIRKSKRTFEKKLAVMK